MMSFSGNTFFCYHFHSTFSFFFIFFLIFLQLLLLQKCQWGCVLSSVMAILLFLVLLLTSFHLYVSWLSSLSLCSSFSRCLFLSPLHNSLLISCWFLHSGILSNTWWSILFLLNLGIFEFWVFVIQVFNEMGIGIIRLF